MIISRVECLEMIEFRLPSFDVRAFDRQYIGGKLVPQESQEHHPR